MKQWQGEGAELDSQIDLHRIGHGKLVVMFQLGLQARM